MLHRKTISVKYKLVFCHGWRAQSEAGGSPYRHEHQGPGVTHDNL